MTISCDLDGHDEAFVHAQITAGRYQSVTEVVHQALSLLRANEAALSALDAKISEGLADIEADRVHDADLAFDHLLTRLEQMPQPLEG